MLDFSNDWLLNGFKDTWSLLSESPTFLIVLAFVLVANLAIYLFEFLHK